MGKAKASRKARTQRISDFVHYTPAWPYRPSWPSHFRLPYHRSLKAHIEALAAEELSFEDPLHPDLSPDDRMHPLFRDTVKVREGVERDLIRLKSELRALVLDDIAHSPPQKPADLSETVQAATSALLEAAYALRFLREGRAWEAAEHLMNLLGGELVAAVWGRWIAAGKGTEQGGKESVKRTADLADDLVKALAETEALKGRKHPTAPKFWAALWNRHRIPRQAFSFVSEGQEWRAWLDPKGAKKAEELKGRIYFATSDDVDAWYSADKDKQLYPFSEELSTACKTFCDHVRDYRRKPPHLPIGANR